MDTNRVSQKFCNILLCASLWCVYQVSEVVQQPFMVGSIMVVGRLTHGALFQLRYNLKATEMNVQWSLIWELIL